MVLLTVEEKFMGEVLFELNLENERDFRNSVFPSPWEHT